MQVIVSDFLIGPLSELKFLLLNVHGGDTVLSLISKCAPKGSQIVRWMAPRDNLVKVDAI